MSAEDLDVDLDYLISLVQDKPSLWDKTSEDFSNRFLRASDWATICNILFPGYDEFDDAKRNRIGNDVVKKWRSVKDNFFRYVKKTKENKESGLPAKKMKKYHYYNQLRFLLKVAHHESDLPQETDNSNPIRKVAIMDPQPSSTAKTLGHSPVTVKRATASRPEQLQYNNGFDPVGTQEEREERHSLFFKGIMPSIANLNELQTLTFQSRVLQLIAEIRFGQQAQMISSTSSGFQTAEHQYQSSSSSRSDTNMNCNDDSQEEVDFTIKIEKE